MKRMFFLATLCVFLMGCQQNHCLFKNYCQKDYWGDTQFDIFGRKNCVGETGHWVDQNNGHGGFYCTSPQCRTPDTISCKDTCCRY